MRHALAMPKSTLARRIGSRATRLFAMTLVASLGTGALLSSGPITQAGATGGSTLAWAELTGPSPTARYGASMAYDTATGEMVLFGGNKTVTTGFESLSTTWVLKGKTWSELRGTGPTAAQGTSMAYDPAMGAVVLFGGYFESLYLSTTWILKDTTWTKLAIADPTPRVGASMAYDPAIGAMVLYGGVGGTRVNPNVATFLSTTWILKDTQWTKLTVPGPTARSGAGMVYDTATGEMVLFGGQQKDGGNLSTTWVFKDTQWTNANATGPTEPQDSPMTYDPAIKAILAAVHASGTEDSDASTWTFADNAWTELKTVLGPRTRRYTSMAYDSTIEAAVLFGGFGVSGALSTIWLYGSTFKASQTVTFTSSPPSRAVADTFTHPSTVTATDTAHTTVAFHPATETVCFVTGSTVYFISAGTCQIVATGQTNSTYRAAMATQTFPVKFAATTTLSASTSTSTYGTSVTFTAKVTPSGTGIPGGTVAIKTGTTTICTTGELSRLSPPSTTTYEATCSSAVLTAGAHALVASYATTAFWASTSAATKVTVARATPTTPTITNLPTGGVYGGGFTATVATDGDGTTSVTSNSTSVCTAGGLVITYVGVGTCSLNAHVGPGTDYTTADGTAQTFTVGRATPTTPTITNLPTGGVYGGGFTATVATDGDGTTSVTSNSTSVCTTSGLEVTYVGVGTCSLTAHVTAGTDYSAASGSPQTFAVTPGSPSPATGVVATPDSATTTITLIWSPPSSNGGSPITGYEVLRGTSPGQEGSTPIATVIGTAYTDTTALPGTTYYYVIVAVTAAGTSVPSAEVSAELPVAGPTGRSFAATPGGGGWWIVRPDGGVFAYGSAGFYGSLPGLGVSVDDIVGVTGTPDAKGYWLVGADGGVFSFGDAAFYGSMGGRHLNEPIVGITSTPDGKGYWLVASDGGIFAFGDAAFYGSTGAIHLNQPVVAMAPAPNGQGYWLVAADGGIFAFGDATFSGSTGGIVLSEPVIGMAATPNGQGYWLVASDGGVFAFGDASYDGSLGSTVQSSPILGLAPLTGGDYELIHADGTATRFGG